MKLFVNNKVYVQKNDLAYFMRGTEGISIPSSIINKVFGQVFIVTDENRYEFVEFSSPEEIDFFKKCDWIVDYNLFDGMTENQIVEYGCQINTERNKIATSFNELPEEERERQYIQASTKIELLEFKMWSVRDILWHKQGHLKFTLPNGTNIDYLISNDNEIAKKENVVQRVLRRIKKR